MDSIQKFHNLKSTSGWFDNIHFLTLPQYTLQGCKEGVLNAVHHNFLVIFSYLELILIKRENFYQASPYVLGMGLRPTILFLKSPLSETPPLMPVNMIFFIGGPHIAQVAFLLLTKRTQVQIPALPIFYYLVSGQ